MPAGTEELFRSDSYLKQCDATVVSVVEDGVVLDRTVFYPTGGGQPGDSGSLTVDGSEPIKVITTRKDRDTGELIHVIEQPNDLQPGQRVVAAINWDQRYRYMRMHTCLHLLCSLIDAPVTGGNISDGKGRLDFILPEPPDKQALTEQLNGLVSRNAPVSFQWISDAEMDAQPELVRTMSVQPPRGAGQVRLVNVEGIDLQPCGGTHLRNAGEIGVVTVSKIENKGKNNRRIVVALS